MVRICDCFAELKAATGAREQRCRAHPDRATPEGPQGVAEVKSDAAA